ncbi:MAG: hypothetical protein OEL50_02040 [Rhodospirillaceae bacterium]|nr:hypothetical protein [Rhodospirillaceae bacterium]
MLADNMLTKKTNNKNAILRQWAYKLALVALAIQVLMPIANAVAMDKINESGNISPNSLVLCTQFGIQVKTITPDGNTKPGAKTVWDCPICQLQIGGDEPKPLAFAFIADTQEKCISSIGTDDLLVGDNCPRPNQPRAPPVV